MKNKISKINLYLKRKIKSKLCNKKSKKRKIENLNNDKINKPDLEVINNNNDIKEIENKRISTRFCYDTLNYSTYSNNTYDNDEREIDNIYNAYTTEVFNNDVINMSLYMI